jgi:hypothetical protein
MSRLAAWMQAAMTPAESIRVPSQSKIRSSKRAAISGSRKKVKAK